jgi:RNA polymerase sigma factor FliA
VRLTDEEVAQLWVAYEQPESQGVALEALVAHYEPLARFLARRALSRAPAHQDAEDLLSSAHQGLLDAVRRFEPARGLKFETYASRRIAGAIVDGQRKDDPLTRSARKRVNTLRDAQRGLWDALGRQPTMSELAEAIGEPESAVRELLVQQQTLTKELDAAAESAVRVGDETQELYLDSLGTESRQEISLRLARLSGRDRVFVLLYYVEQRTLREIGQRFGCSDSRCAQIRKEVMHTLLSA